MTSLVMDGHHLAESVDAIGRLVHRGLKVDTSVFYRLLQRCITHKDLALGSRVHALAVQSGFQSNAFLCNHIICMYAAHGQLLQATQVFTTVAAPNRFMWASIILAHARQGQPAEALRLYHRMRKSSVKPDDRVFVAVLRACAGARDVDSGRAVHADVLLAAAAGDENQIDPFVGNGLVDMYVKCGSLEDAQEVFDRLPARDVVTWTALIAGYAQRGLGDKALALYSTMQQQQQQQEGGGGRVEANHVTFVCLLQACASTTTSGPLHEGRKLHAQIVERGLGNDLVVGTALVDMYAKCGSPEDAFQVFENLPRKNVVTWNAMISGFASHGLGREALALYERMDRDCCGGTPAADCVTFVCLLQACAVVGALDQGTKLHSRIRERGLEADVVVGNSLVNMYAKCRSVEQARRVFDGLQQKDVASWNAMISGYSQNGRSREALALYGRMQREPVASPPDGVTFVALLQACGHLADLSAGEKIHSQVCCQLGLHEATDDVCVANALVDMYVKCGRLDKARSLFDSLPAKDVVTWTTMIAGYAQHHELAQDALTLYAGMRKHGIRPVLAVTFVCLLQVCATLKALCQGTQLHAELKERGGLETTDVTVGTALVDMYAKCGSLDKARSLFDKLPTKNVVTWTAMIAGYTHHGLPEDALCLYEAMLVENVTPPNAVTFVPLLQACASLGALQQGKQLHSQIEERGLDGDVVVGTSLVDMYAKCGSLETARQVFETLPSRNVVTWNAMIAGYSQHGLVEEAFGLYARMQGEGGGVGPPDSVTLASLLQACGIVAALEMGKDIHAEILTTMGLEATADLQLAHALIDMYVKCGGMVDAQQVFDALPRRDTVTWSAMIAGYSHQGESVVALDLFHRMRQDGVRPDGVTFLSILTACSHAGLVDKGESYFEAMSRDCGITPTMEHYTCMVDLLGRAGHVERAMEIVRDMPFEPDGMLWRCVLGACQKWGKVELGKQAFERALKLDEQDGAAYVLMSNIYAEAQMWDDMRDVQGMRLKARAWKEPGECWWTDCSGTVHTFTAYQ